jgi:hypothetical protein
MKNILEQENKASNNNEQLQDLEKQLKELEDETYLTEDYVEFPPVDIVAYNEQRSCADLLRMSQNNQLVIDPDFQREIVWSDSLQTRFIDSLIKQLPIPSMCISLDYKTEKRYVIDGLQRIASIIRFLTQDEWKLSKLLDIDPNISGKKVYEIKVKHKELYERVENITIPITVIRYDSTKTHHNNYIFTIFHRLNTGGQKLNNQEIRNCIYNGSFNTFLKKCVIYPNWQILMNIEKNKTYRFEYEELILRFFAFYDDYQIYKGTLAKFLNNYMDKHRYAEQEFLNNKEKLFQETIDLIYTKITNKKPLKTSKVLTEGLLLGVAKNIEKLAKVPDSILQDKYKMLKESEPFASRNIIEGLLQKDKVRNRINESIRIFSLENDQ